MADGSLALVDTPYTPEATGTMLDWAEDTLGERQITAVNTGYHYDNLGGNAELVQAGIPVYGSDAIPGLIAERGGALRALTLGWLSDPKMEAYRAAHEALEYVPPDHLFPLRDGLTLSFGEEELVVFFPGPTHAADNVVVYFPARRILFGGCMILAGEAVGNTSDADLAAWPESIERLRVFDADLVVPGHGDRMDPGLIDHTLEILAGSGGG
jgi:glyoxylase-like metal-dependent hydrolase (beta-lactamase superfamily II)